MKVENSPLPDAPEGILLVDKPQGFTSHDVVAKARGLLRTRKIGHGGTLDPMATGLLPLFVGRAAKAVDLQLDQNKTYEAVFLFGLSTDTGDITGQPLAQSETVITRQAVESALPGFLGPISQLPPMYSAVKVNGKALYHYARAGQAVQRKPRSVTIHAIDYLADLGQNRHSLRVRCSKGTYIRTLVEDMGGALGVPAVLAQLRRTAAGVFNVANAHTLDALQAAKDAEALPSLLLPVELVFEALPALSISLQELARLQNGAAVHGRGEAPGRYRALLAAPGRAFAGLVLLGSDKSLRAEKLFL